MTLRDQGIRPGVLLVIAAHSIRKLAARGRSEDRDLAAHYAFSDVAMEHGGSMGTARALSLAAVDVLERTGRDLHRARNQAELNWEWPEELYEDELERIRAVRRTAPR